MFCNDLLSLDSQTIEDLHIKVNRVTNLPEVNCFSKHLHTFLQVRQVKSKNLVSFYQWVPTVQNIRVEMNIFIKKSFEVHKSFLWGH